MKINLLHSSILTDYYLSMAPSTIKFVDKLKREKKTGKSLSYISTIAMPEVFTAFSKKYFHDNTGPASLEYYKKKDVFIQENSRDFKMKKFQPFAVLELNRYHMVLVHLLYQPVYEYLRIAHAKGLHLGLFPSSIDLLTITQAIDLTNVYSDNQVTLITTDKLVADICRYLRGLMLKDKIVFLAGPDKKGVDLVAKYGNLKSYSYPKVHLVK